MVGVPPLEAFKIGLGRSLLQPDQVEDAHCRDVQPRDLYSSLLSQTIL